LSAETTKFVRIFQTCYLSLFSLLCLALGKVLVRWRWGAEGRVTSLFAL